MSPSLWAAVVLAVGSAKPTAAAPTTPPTSSAAATPAEAGSGDDEATPQAAARVTLDEELAPSTADDDQRPPSEKPGFGGSFILDNEVPSGTFITNNPYTFNPAVSTNLFLRPHYVFKAGTQSLKLQLWQNFYIADVLDKNAVVTNQFTWNDTKLSLFDDKIWTEPHTHIVLNGYVRGSIPISYQSQYETKITTLTAGVGIAKNLYRFNLVAGISFSKNFDRYTSAQIPCSASAITPLAIVPGEDPDISSLDVLSGFENGICGNGNTTTPPSFMNVSWAMVPKVGATYNFTDRLSFSLTLYYFDQFFYPITGNPAYDSQIRDSNGNLVVTNSGRIDGIWGITDLTYTLTQHWSVSLGLWNGGTGSAGVPPLTERGGIVRIPFLDTYALNNNDWDIYFDITATL
jgi:hypothetical protein